MESSEPIDSLPVDAKADLRWHHVMNAQIASGVIARIGAPAWSVYCVLKSHADMRTGISSITKAEIARLTGISIASVSRALRTIAEDGLIENSISNNNDRQCRLIETIPITDRLGKSVAEVKGPYVPVEFSNALGMIREFVKTGDSGLDAGPVLEFHIHLHGNNNAIALGRESSANAFNGDSAVNAALGETDGMTVIIDGDGQVHSRSEGSVPSPRERLRQKIMRFPKGRK